MKRADLLARVVTADEVISPLSGLRGAFIHVELVELLERERVLGELILGDVVIIALEPPEDGNLSIVARRAVFRRVGIAEPLVPIETVPPELVPLLASATGGPLGYREHRVLQGDRIRLQAVVERQGQRVVIRDDLDRIQVDEVLRD